MICKVITFVGVNPLQGSELRAWARGAVVAGLPAEQIHSGRWEGKALSTSPHRSAPLFRYIFGLLQSASLPRSDELLNPMFPCEPPAETWTVCAKGRVSPGFGLSPIFLYQTPQQLMVLLHSILRLKAAWQHSFQCRSMMVLQPSCHKSHVCNDCLLLLSSSSLKSLRDSSESRILHSNICIPFDSERVEIILQ